MQLIACVPARKLLVFILMYICCSTANAQLTANFTVDRNSGCAPFQVNFKDESTGNPTSWRWDLGNNTISTERNPSTSYLNPGRYKVTLIVSNASGSATKDLFITVHASPTIDFTASTLSGCYPLKVTFNDNSLPGDGTIASRRWDFGDGNTTGEKTETSAEHTYLNPGNYKVSLQVTNSFGCKTTATPVEVRISNGVTSLFSVSAPSSCSLPMSFTFTNQSSGTGNLTYEWDFDDGTTSTDFNPPPHVFTAAREYNVTLTVRSDNGCVNTYTRKVAVSEATSSFTAPAVSCVGVPVSFTNTSSPAPVSSRWIFSDGTTTTEMNPTKTFSTPGTYTITLNNDFGSCQGSTSKTIQIVPRPTVDFSADNTKSCQAFTANFTANVAGAIGYEWDFGDGTTSTQQNPQHTFTTERKYTVSLTITTASGCKITVSKQDYIEIKKPVVRFANLPLEGCLPYSFTPALIIETIDPIVDYRWTFGDGGTGTGANYTHTYTTPGRYDVTLQYTTRGGCTFTVTEPGAVLVGNKPVVNFSASKKDFCAFDGVNFTDLSTATPAVDKWLWNFGDGEYSTQKNPHHVYADVGLMDVTLTVWSNGCKSDPKTIREMVRPMAPVANFYVSDICTSNPYYRKFNDASLQAETWSWDFGDGTFSNERNPGKTYAAKGKYTVRLTVSNSNGCIYIASNDVLIIDDKPSLIASDDLICRGSSVNFEVRGATPANVAAYNWTTHGGPVGSGTNRHQSTFYNKGIFNTSVTIVDVNGCTVTLSKPTEVIAPVADFNPLATAICVNNNVNFTDNSRPASPAFPINQWEMTFEPGVTQVVTPPTFQHQYTKGGRYDITLKVTDSKGCTDVITKPGAITIGDPKAAFSAPNTLSCTGKNITFVNQSVGDGLSFEWQFGDGKTSTSYTPAPHTYAAEGDYTIKLMVKDRYGCTDAHEKIDYIKIYNPVAKIVNPTVKVNCPPLDARFINDSKNYISQTWDFGDGTGTTLKDPSKFYTKPGIFKVLLTVTSHGGCTDTDEQIIDIEGPKGSFTYKKLNDCVPVKVEFQGTTNDNASFIWDFNNGVTIGTTDSKITYEYKDPRTYVPTMILKDNASDCRVPYQGTEIIEAFGVKTDFTMDKNLLCDKGSVSFTDHSLSNDRIKSYKWVFDDGNESSLKNPVHPFSGTGNYDVSLKVITDHGCEDIKTDKVKIVQSPKAKITGPAPACAPALFAFNGHLDNGDTSTSFKWEWDFANGQQALQQNPAPVQYTKDGNYTVKLKLTNSSGCTNEALYAVTVHPLPQLTLTPDFVLCRDQPKIIRASGADTYTWDNAASLSCDDCATPMANPTQDTKYTVTGKTAFGCEAKAEINVAVQQPFTLTVNRCDTLCLGEKYGLVASGADLYQWTPSTGLNNSNLSNPVAQPTTTTTYTVTGTDKNGCFTESKSIPLTVYPYPKVDLGPDQTLAVGYSLELKPTISNDAIAIKWTPSTGLSCTTCPTPTASPKQNVTYKIEVTNEGGCKASDVMSIFMICKGENMYLPNTFSPNGDAHNETFYPRGKGLAYVKSFRIFNRWGEVVFEAANFHVNDRTKGWNGMYKGKPASLDVYVYTIDVVCENNEILNLKGDVTLLR